MKLEFEVESAEEAPHRLQLRQDVARPGHTLDRQPAGYEIWGGGDGRMPPAAGAGQSTEHAVREWLQGTVLRLGSVQVAAVLAALITTCMFRIRRHIALARTVLLPTLPFALALAVCAAQPDGVWFQ